MCGWSSSIVRVVCVREGEVDFSIAYLPFLLTHTHTHTHTQTQLGESSLWKVKVSTLQLLQVSVGVWRSNDMMPIPLQIMVFENLFVFHSQEADITSLLLLLMQDSQLEVCVVCLSA